jgi:RNA polymerase sigma-70 factor (ECF subfamily)
MADDRNEQELIARARAGDDSAFSCLLLRYSERLQGFVAPRIPESLRRRFDTDDVGEMTFIRAWSGIGSFGGEDGKSFYAWLRTIAKNTVLDCIKAEKAGKRNVDLGRNRTSLLLSLSHKGPGPSSAVAAREAVEHLEKALSRLKPEHREVIEMRFYAGLSVREIASRAGIREGAVSMRLNRAIGKLREDMGPLPE